MIYGMSMVRLGRLADARAALEFALAGNPTSTTLRLALLALARSLSQMPTA